MGLEVSIVKSTARIPKQNLKRAYEAMCLLDITHDSVKFGKNEKTGEKWFSFMPSDYVKKFKSAKKILKTLGFEVEYNDDGDLLILGFDAKMGQEDLFLEAIDNLAVGKIKWTCETDETWKTKFHGDTVIEGELVVDLLPAPQN